MNEVLVWCAAWSVFSIAAGVIVGWVGRGQWDDSEAERALRDLARRGLDG